MNMDIPGQVLNLPSLKTVPGQHIAVFATGLDKQN